MATTPHRPETEELTSQERLALVRQLTNMLNQREMDRRHFNEHFRRYGVLIEGLFKQLEDQKTRLDEMHELMRRVHNLGIWWEHQEVDQAWEAEANA